MNVQWLKPFAIRHAKQRPPAGIMAGPSKAAPVTDAQTGFVHHPCGFPLDYKRLWFSSGDRLDAEGAGNFGLIFESDEHVPVGASLEVIIPLRNELEHFRGKVVLVRQAGDCYEIGVWFPCRADASRVRIVEQICHIEAYLRHKKFSEGPYNLNRERLAEEWISRNAAGVPAP